MVSGLPLTPLDPTLLPISTSIAATSDSFCCSERKSRSGVGRSKGSFPKASSNSFICTGFRLDSEGLMAGPIHRYSSVVSVNAYPKSIHQSSVCQYIHVHTLRSLTSARTFLSVWANSFPKTFTRGFGLTAWAPNCLRRIISIQFQAHSLASLP
jgi:hypothetical protein